jgi:hypothetical protein
MAARRAAPFVSPSLRFVHGTPKLVVLQQLDHGTHPWFPQIGHFLIEKCLPQTRLLVA